MVELQIISRILEVKNLSLLTLNNITNDFFHTYNEEIDYITSHYEQYNNVPDTETFLGEFQDFDLLAVAESDKYLIDTLCEEHNYFNAVNIINKTADLMQADSWEAVNYLKNNVELLTKKNTVIGTDIISTAQTRLDDYIALKENPNQYLLPTGFKELDDIIGGFRRSEELVVLFARTGNGKEQPLTSNILTPNGWTKMGDINVGDTIYSGTSETCRVIGVFPQGLKDVYRLTFSDGTYAECGLDHLWKVQKGDDRKHNRFRVLTLKDILKDIPYKSHKNYSIPFIQPIEYAKQKLVIPPYLLGVLLGDGCFVNDTTVTLSDKELQQIVQQELQKLGYSLKATTNKNNIEFRIICTSKPKIAFSRLLCELGLQGLKSKQKFIPKQYLYSTIDDRVELLRGLMDTDGYASTKQQSEQFFNTSSNQLFDGVTLLCRELGCYAKTSEYETSYVDKKLNKRVNCGTGYEIRIKSLFNVFKIQSKAGKWKLCNQQFNKYIKSIELVRKEECQCIMVDHPDHTYITDGHTITHNTWILIKMLEHLWKMNYRVGLVEPEMSPEKIGYRFDTLNGNISNSSLLKGKDLENYEEYINNLKDKQVPLFVAHPKEFNRKITVSKLKSFVETNNLDVLAIDGISYLTDERANRGDNRTTALTNISEDLMDLSIQLKVPVIVVAQSNREGAKTDDLGLENIRDSDGIAYNSSLIFAIQQKDPGLVISTLKNRNGINGKKLSYIWDIDIGKFNFVPDEDTDIEVTENVRRRFKDSEEKF